MRLVDWAKKEGISYRTAWRWFHAGKLPVPAIQTETGMILVKDEQLAPSTGTNAIVVYSRVSSNDQKEDLERQTERLRQFASAKGWVVSNVVEEIGSGLNGRRLKLIRILKDPNAGRILVEHRDRLSRFGFEFIEAALMSQGRSIIVADETEETSDIWQDFIDVVTSMCARIYGRRGARNRAKRAVKAVASNEDQKGIQDRTSP